MNPYRQTSRSSSNSKDNAKVKAVKLTLAIILLIGLYLYESSSAAVSHKDRRERRERRRQRIRHRRDIVDVEKQLLPAVLPETVSRKEAPAADGDATPAAAAAQPEEEEEEARSAPSVFDAAASYVSNAIWGSDGRDDAGGSSGDDFYADDDDDDDDAKRNPETMTEWRAILSEACTVAIAEAADSAEDESSLLDSDMLSFKADVETDAIDRLDQGRPIDKNEGGSWFTYAPCQHAFIDVGANVERSLASFVEHSLDVCTPIWLEAAAAGSDRDDKRKEREMPRPRLVRDEDGDYWHFESATTATSDDEDDSARALRDLIRKYAVGINMEDLCVYGLESNTESSDRLHKMQDFVMDTFPRPIKHMGIQMGSAVSKPVPEKPAEPVVADTTSQQPEEPIAADAKPAEVVADAAVANEPAEPAADAGAADQPAAAEVQAAATAPETPEQPPAAVAAVVAEVAPVEPAAAADASSSEPETNKVEPDVVVVESAVVDEAADDKQRRRLQESENGLPSLSTVIDSTMLAFLKLRAADEGNQPASPSDNSNSGMRNAFDFFGKDDDGTTGDEGRSSDEDDNFADVDGGLLMIKLDVGSSDAERQVLQEVVAAGVLCDFVGLGNTAVIITEGKIDQKSEASVKALEECGVVFELLKN